MSRAAGAALSTAVPTEPEDPTLRSELFPPIAAHAEGRLPVEEPHVLHWSEAGNPAGIPVVFLHGGPGAGCLPAYRRFFDPGAYRIILFDQRGAGLSRPHARVEENDTQRLVADMELLRCHLGVERWLLFGGSWGSTLALAYGETHPERCLGFVLRGVFLGTAGEVDWFLHGMGRFFPHARRAFLAALDPAERGDVLAAYHARLTHPDPAVHIPAARAWSRYESACSALRPVLPAGGLAGADLAALAIARIEAHYFVHGMFLEPDQLMRDIGRLEGLPCTIVQGRYDMVCPPATADRLAHAWGSGELVIVDDAGHSAMEPGVRGALVRATERMKAALGR